MAVTAYFYGHFAEALLKGNMGAFGTATYKMMLCTSSYTPNQDTHQDKADVTNEVSGTGYNAGGAALTTVSVTQTANVVKVDCDNVSWTDSTITARYAVVYDDTEAADADKKLVGYIDFGEDKSSENGTFQVTINASGLFTFTAEDA